MRVLSFKETKGISGATLPPAMAAAMQSTAAFFNTTLGSLWAATAAPAGAAPYGVLARVGALVASPAGAAVITAGSLGWQAGQFLNTHTGIQVAIADVIEAFESDPADAGGGSGGGEQDETPVDFTPWDGSYNSNYDSSQYDYEPTPGGYWVWGSGGGDDNGYY